MDVILMPKTEKPITTNVFVDRFIEYVRGHHYPAFDEDYIMFDVNGRNRLAMCSELPVNEHEATLECIREGIHDDDEDIGTFEGGLYSVIGDFDFMVYVDGHLYFFDF